jgi:hypothetical protein
MRSRNLLSSPLIWGARPMRARGPATARPYFTLELLEGAEPRPELPSEDLPRATKVNGRFCSPLVGSKKDWKEVANWLWTSKQNRLSLPSYKYHEKSYIKAVEPVYASIQSRAENKLTWVRLLLFLIPIYFYLLFRCL